MTSDSEDLDDRRFHDRGGLKRRTDQRLRSLLPGLILFDGEETSRNVIILNRSAIGAKLRYTAGPLPETFALIDQQAGLAHVCRVVWKDMPDVGVVYEKTLDVKNDQDRLVSRLQSLWRSQIK